MPGGWAQRALCRRIAPVSSDDGARGGGARARLARLRDGAAVTIREVGPGDEARLHTFLGDLGLKARRMRFFSAAADLGAAARWDADTGSDHRGLIAFDESGQVAGHAAWARLAPDRAEVAVEVADRLHGRGLGTMLLARLAADAEARGITALQADVLAENEEMLICFRDGFDAHVALDGSGYLVTFPSAAWRLAQERFAAVHDGRTASST